MLRCRIHAALSLSSQRSRNLQKQVPATICSIDVIALLGVEPPLDVVAIPTLCYRFMVTAIVEYDSQ